jgi:Domain of unknown function (DUF4276)
VKITIYVEGGGDDNACKAKCRKGFKKFFENATLKGQLPKVVACGSRNNAHKDFCTALTQSKSDEFPILLVDSEELVTVKQKWAHLQQRDGWKKPEKASESHVFLMIVCMESWLLADKEALQKYYDQHFNEKSLPSCTEIEEIEKNKVLTGLKEATKNTKKGCYSKGGHSFELLEKIDPQKLLQVSPSARELIEQLKT